MYVSRNSNRALSTPEEPNSSPPNPTSNCCHLNFKAHCVLSHSHIQISAEGFHVENEVTRIYDKSTICKQHAEQAPSMRSSLTQLELAVQTQRVNEKKLSSACCSRHLKTLSPRRLNVGLFPEPQRQAQHITIRQEMEKRRKTLRQTTSHLLIIMQAVFILQLQIVPDQMLLSNWNT